MSATATVLLEAPAERVYRVGSVSPAETYQPRELSWSSNRTSGHTAHLFVDDGAARVLPRAPVGAAIPVQAGVRARSIDISVISALEDVVLCETVIDGRTVSLRLAKGLFPNGEDAPRFGSNYVLSMTTEGGLRRPVIAAAPPRPDTMAELKQDMWRLVDEIE